MRQVKYFILSLIFPQLCFLQSPGFMLSKIIIQWSIKALMLNELYNIQYTEDYKFYAVIEDTRI